MRADEFIANMLRAGCYFDPHDEHKLIIPEDIAEQAGVLPGYFHISDPVDGKATVRMFSPDGTEQLIQ